MFTLSATKLTFIYNMPLKLFDAGGPGLSVSGDLSLQGIILSPWLSALYRLVYLFNVC